MEIIKVKTDLAKFVLKSPATASLKVHMVDLKQKSSLQTILLTKIYTNCLKTEETEDAPDCKRKQHSYTALVSLLLRLPHTSRHNLFPFTCKYKAEKSCRPNKVGIKRSMPKQIRKPQILQITSKYKILGSHPLEVTSSQTSVFLNCKR